MKTDNLKIYQDYAGAEAVSSFLAGFAPAHAQLADWTVDFVYGQVIGDAHLSFRQKASIVTLILMVVGDSPSALRFHSHALIQHASSDRPIKRHEELALLIHSGEIAATALEPDDYLAVIGALCALGEPYAPMARVIMLNALERGISVQDIKGAISLVCAYRGFPLAIAGAAILQAILQGGANQI